MTPDKSGAPRALMIAGTHSGVGKTSLTVALQVALRERGLTVQGFKVGPDYIDSTYHEWATGRPGRNLDTWLMGRAGVRHAFARAATGVDWVVIEGMMGLLDGREATSDLGSSAEVARLLGVRVVLVLDGQAMARSAAAVVLGFQRMLPRGTLCGVVCNRVDGAGHARLLRAAIEAATAVPVLGTIASLASSLPERHLGLVPVIERPALALALSQLTRAIADGLDMSSLLAVAASPRPLTRAAARTATRPRVRIAVAHDAAFSFYYADNLELLAQAGAELVFFSPLAGERIPVGVAGLYIGGGFPEEYAAPLEEQVQVREDIRRHVDAGMPTFAECGGYMYLTEAVRDRTGRRHRLVGAIAAQSCMHERLVGFGYREVEALQDGPLLRRGERARGHEFHHSSIQYAGTHARPALRRLDRSAGADEGYQRANLFASYVHLHFASNPAMARRFVAACARWRRGARSTAPG